MKIQTLLFIILITNCVYCQEYYTEYTKASFVTQNRDTLYLIDDPLGHTIKKTWEDKKLKDIKPVIIFKDYIWIEEKHKALKYEKVN
tara:strand:+ start:2289 stop:2549 length:261 start_codon:yes stop_codon:yes gene_type:complete